MPAQETSRRLLPSAAVRVSLTLPRLQTAAVRRRDRRRREGRDASRPSHSHNRIDREVSEIEEALRQWDAALLELRHEGRPQARRAQGPDDRAVGRDLVDLELEQLL